MAIVGRVRHKTLDLKIAVQILSDGKVVFDQQHPGLEHSHGMPSAQRLGSVAHQGTNTLPGFIRPWGSSTCLMRCISASRSEEHTSELQSLMRISYAVFCLKKKKQIYTSQQMTQNKHTPNINSSKQQTKN